MELKQLFDMQRTLDERIIKQHGLEGKELLDQRILALNVELAELAQETRCFKFWSTNKQSSERVLDELVDVLHFVLSVGIETGLEENFAKFYEGNIELVVIFNHLFNLIGDFHYSSEGGEYFRLTSCFVRLVKSLGFTWEQVTQAYIEKNKENHDRQDRGY